MVLTAEKNISVELGRHISVELGPTQQNQSQKYFEF
jgi:hypothetical protein